MPLVKVNESQKRILVIAIILSIIAGFLFLRVYMMLIIFSAIMAYLFSPVQDYFVKKGKSQNKSAVYTFIISVVVIIVPLIFIILITVFQIEKLVNNIASGDYSVTMTDVGNSIINSFNSFMARLGISYTLNVQQLADAVSAAVVSFGKTMLEGIASSISGFFAFITTAIIYIYVFLAMVKYKVKIIDTIKRLNPLGNEVSELYLDRVGAMTKATVRGQFIIAFMQGLESAAVLTLVGMNDLFFFFLIFLTVLSLIPLGAGIVTIPMGIIMILTGNIWQGVLVIANHLLIVTNIDNVMRPKLVPKNARLEPALMILAVFSGVALFGFIGIVIGPVIMILLITTLQIFLEVFYSIESINRERSSKKTSRFASLRNKFSTKS